MRESRQVIDDLDRRILRALRDQPRATLGELAEHVGVSRTTFRVRLDRLWDSGIIVGRETQLELASMGFEVQAWVELEVVQGRLSEIREALLAMPQVIEAFSTTGDADVRCRVAARGTGHLQEVLLEIANCPAVTRTRSCVILDSLVAHRKVQALDLLDL
ncbi:MAG: Lrp/AsnC family transcriptional regulator [Microbacterium sp.]|uniref:Lrp/AsnC family transcriptional regulator n=1 Tax=Microbacterium sp. TaxID=51671 RepID=UPI0039E48AEA